MAAALTLLNDDVLLVLAQQLSGEALLRLSQTHTRFRKLLPAWPSWIDQKLAREGWPNETTMLRELDALDAVKKDCDRMDEVKKYGDRIGNTLAQRFRKRLNTVLSTKGSLYSYTKVARADLPLHANGPHTPVHFWARKQERQAQFVSDERSTEKVIWMEIPSPAFCAVLSGIPAGSKLSGSTEWTAEVLAAAFEIHEAEDEDLDNDVDKESVLVFSKENLEIPQFAPTAEYIRPICMALTYRVSHDSPNRNHPHPTDAIFEAVSDHFTNALSTWPMIVARTVQLGEDRQHIVHARDVAALEVGLSRFTIQEQKGSFATGMEEEEEFHAVFLVKPVNNDILPLTFHICGYTATVGSDIERDFSFEYLSGQALERSNLLTREGYAQVATMLGLTKSRPAAVLLVLFVVGLGPRLARRAWHCLVTNIGCGHYDDHSLEVEFLNIVVDGKALENNCSDPGYLSIKTMRITAAHIALRIWLVWGFIVVGQVSGFSSDINLNGGRAKTPYYFVLDCEPDDFGTLLHAGGNLICTFAPSIGTAAARTSIQILANSYTPTAPRISCVFTDDTERYGRLMQWT
ncbi:hypothetical protein HDU89_007694 [Geranomyces variabilis]|nr:hypothetical protein HDU89_007694 [Geranomyces variabilis]